MKSSPPLFTQNKHILPINILQTGHPCAHVSQHQIEDGYRRHAFNYDRSPRDDDRIVTPSDLQSMDLPILSQRLLLSGNRWSRFEKCPEDHLSSITHSAQNAACVVGQPAVPSPISTAFTAPIENSACPRRPSSLSNTGSPIPAGSPSTRHSTTPPAESSLLMQSFK